MAPLRRKKQSTQSPTGEENPSSLSNMEKNRPTIKVVGARSAKRQRVRIDDPDIVALYNETGKPIPWPIMRRQLAKDLKPGSRDSATHVAILAPTRQGKTTLAMKGLLPIYTRAGIPVLIIDSTGDPKLAKVGERLPKVGKLTEVHAVHVNDLSHDSKLKIHQALSRAYKQGDVLIYADEVRQLADKSFFGLGAALDNIWIFGGKRGVTMIGSTQAPRYVPSNFYDQSQAHFLFKIRDLRARRRLAEIGGDTQLIMETAADLPKYHWAYVNPDGEVVVSKMDLPKNTPSGGSGAEKK